MSCFCGSPCAEFPNCAARADSTPPQRWGSFILRDGAIPFTAEAWDAAPVGSSQVVDAGSGERWIEPPSRPVDPAAYSEQRAHEFSQEQHVETFAKLAEAERATAMAMRMHDVQYERANRLQAQLDEIRDIAAEVLGHGADTVEGEMWRLRTIISRIEAVVDGSVGSLEDPK